MSMVFLLTKIFENLSEGLGLPGRGRFCAVPRRQREHLIQGGLVSNEAKVAEAASCLLELLGGEFEDFRYGAKRIVTDSVAVTDQHEEEVKEHLGGSEVFEVAVSQQAVVEPAERWGDFTDTLRSQDTFCNHGKKGRGRMRQKLWSLVYRHVPL